MRRFLSRSRGRCGIFATAVACVGILAGPGALAQGSDVEVTVASDDT